MSIDFYRLGFDAAEAALEVDNAVRGVSAEFTKCAAVAQVLKQHETEANPDPIDVGFWHWLLKTLDEVHVKTIVELRTEIGVLGDLLLERKDLSRARHVCIEVSRCAVASRAKRRQCWW